MIILETARLSLRELTHDDAPFILELLNEPAFLQYIGDKGVRTLDDARKYLSLGPLASYTKHGFGLWLVVLRDSNTPVGMCGLLQRDGMAQPDLAYALLAPFRGQGQAREAAAAVLHHARDGLKLPTVQALTAPDNALSIRLLEKLGFASDRMITLPGYPGPSRLFTVKL